MSTALTLEQLERSPIGQQILDQDRRAAFEQRKALLDQLAAAEQELNEALPGLDGELEKAAQSVASARKFLDRCEGQVLQARQKRDAAKAVFASTKTRIERELTSTAPAAIGEFVTELRQQIAVMERSSPAHNRPRPEGATAYIEKRHQAIAAAGKLMFRAVDDVPGEIMKLREIL